MTKEEIQEIIAENKRIIKSATLILGEATKKLKALKSTNISLKNYLKSFTYE